MANDTWRDCLQFGQYSVPCYVSDLQNFNSNNMDYSNLIMDNQLHAFKA